MARSSAQAKPARQRQRQPTEVRRMLIVDAARDVIAERGLFATTMRDIAQASDVSLGTITYHFTGIAEILRELLDRETTLFYEPMIEKAQAEERGIDALHSLIDCYFADDARTVQHWRLWLDYWSISAHDEDYANWQRQSYLRWHEDVRRMFSLAVAQGDITVDDIDQTVADFLAMFDGLAVHAYLPRSPLGPDDVRRQLNDWIRRTLTTPTPKRRRS